MKSKPDKYIDQVLREFNHRFDLYSMESGEPYATVAGGSSNIYYVEANRSVAEFIRKKLAGFATIAEKNYHKGFKRGFENGKIVGADELGDENNYEV